MVKKKTHLPAERVEKSILHVRGQKVMLDVDLADLCDVETKVLLQVVKRKIDRFPDDFAFQLTKQGFNDLRSQSVTSRGSGGRRYPPYVFTEQGVAMLSSVLNSKRAIQVNIEIMRAFVRLIKMLAGHEKLASKIEKLEKKYDAQFKEVFEVIHHLMTPPDKKSRKIGFRKEE
jgi:hypothetical protein